MDNGLIPMWALEAHMARTWIAAAFVSCALAGHATADPMIKHGNEDLSVHVSPDFEGAIGDMIFVQVGYGIFLRDRLEGRATYSYTLLEDVAGEDSDYKMSELGLVGEYHVEFGKDLVPYVGLAIGWGKSEFGSLDESAFVYGPIAGLNYFLADNVALDLAITYRFASADVFINDFQPEDHDLSSSIGLRVMF
jgi:opacity protein-like surface antigen